MKEGLFKKRLGIPAALLILLVLSGVAAAVSVVTFNCTTTTSEPLSFKKTDGLRIGYQGESDDIVVKVTNYATNGYGIFVNANVVKGHIESITYSSANFIARESEGHLFNDDVDKLDARYNIAAGDSYEIVITVDSADDVATGDLTVTLDFHREIKYM